VSFDWDGLVIGPTVAIFGDTVQYVPNIGAAFTVTGVFDQAYLELTPLGRGGPDTESWSMASPGSITAEMPVLGVQLSQFPIPPEQDDLLTITSGRFAGERFVVKEVRPDGHGGAKLLLNAS
jgi:hypothetical protein